MNARKVVELLAVLSLSFANGVLANEYTILVEAKSDSPAGTPVTFGMAFSEHDLPYASEMTATVKINNVAETIPVQVDSKASHCSDHSHEFTTNETCASENRSLRHAVITTVLPASVASGERAEIVLSPSDTESPEIGSSISFPDDLSLKTVIVTGAQTYVADLSSVPTAMLASNMLPSAGTSEAQVSEWLTGGLVREWVVRVPFVEEGLNSVVHPHIISRYNIRHYPGPDITRVDVVVENNWSFAPDVRSYSYSAQIYINDQLRYEEPNLNHFVHARWKVTLWDKSYPELHVRHDPYQLINARVSPNYDPNLVFALAPALDDKYSTIWEQYRPRDNGGVTRHPNKTEICLKSVENVYSARCDDPTAFKLEVNGLGPMGIGVVPARYMPQTGGRVEIAPLPEWTAAWVLQQSYPLYKMMLGIADGSGSWPIHFRDMSSDLPLSTEIWPDTRIKKGSNRAVDVASCVTGANCLNPYVADNAHQSSFAFIPYVVTGDYYYLEEIQFWATFNAAFMAPEYRGGARGLFERASQLRGAAWGMRNLAHAAWVTPDNGKLKSHFQFMLKSNLHEYNAIYLDDPTRRVEYGAAVEYTNDISAPWMDDYFTWSVGHIVELGYESFKPLAEWKGRFPVGRMGLSPRPEDDFCWIFATNYRLRVAPFEDNDNVPVVLVSSGLNTSLRERKMFRNLSDVFRYSNKAEVEGEGLGSGALETRQACASQAQADEQGLEINQMVGYPTSPRGFVAQFQPAIAMSVDVGTENAQSAWERFAERATVPDFRVSPAWSIVPRKLTDERSTDGGAMPHSPPDAIESSGLVGECRAHTAR